MNIFGIILSGTDLWLLAGVGLCLAWLVPHRLSLARGRRANFIKASAAFRAVFTEFLSNISNEQVTRQVQAHVLAANPKHVLAAEEFQLHLNRWDSARFAKAWQQYEATCHHHPYSREKIAESVHVLLRLAV